MPSRLRPSAWISALLVLTGLFAAAQDLRIPSAPGRWVTDQGRFLSAETVASLDARLEAFERETGHQVLVYVGETTGGVPIEEWAVKAFEAWKVGRKGLDDGLVLFIMAGDRKVRIEVGYGLEDRVPDASAFRIIDGILVPGFRSGSQDAAVSEAVASLLSLISGRDEGTAPPGRNPSSGLRRGGSVVNTVFVVIAFVFFLILLITHPSLALWLLINIISGGRGGGGSGGGFSGGGGRSGGGGASGSW
ncbi:MAG: TPM domain-containing protein [Candidatus Aminicenantales bacterium]